MKSQILDLPGYWQISDVSGASYWVAAAAAAAATVVSLLRRPKNPLSKLPTIGSSNWLMSWWDGIRFLHNSSDIIREGYAKYKGTPFKVSTVFGWIVIIGGRELVEEFCKFRDDELNLTEAMNEVLKLEHSFETQSDHHPYHVSVLRSKLNRNLAPLFADMRDEVVAAFDDQLNLLGHEWKSVKPFSIIQRIVSRSNSRMLVGLPLCREPDWVQLNIDFTMSVFKTAALITFFPKLLAPVVRSFASTVSRNSRRAERHLVPLIKARREALAEYGPSWADKPNDFLSWLLDGSQGTTRSANDLTQDILGINFAAIHTISQAFAITLYNLAAKPEYAQVLREEVELIVNEEGWSKASLGKMHKVDSFLKESKRMSVPGFTSVIRKAVKDLTLADGTVLAKGTYVALATEATHLDEEFYDDAETFDPFRFANMRTDEAVDDHRLPSTNPEFLAFGHGKNACPGRFFAATLLDVMLAHVVVSYDVKLEKEVIPGIGAAAGISDSARVVFRKRIA